MFPSGRLGGLLRAQRMSDVAAPSTAKPDSAPPWARGLRVVLWLAALALLFLVLDLFGIDIWSWLGSVWDTITAISFGYIVLGVVFQTLQTGLTALAWFGILRAGYPDVGLKFAPVWAAYAVSV